MRIHHLNCATQCALGGCLISGQGSVFDRARLICHCLLLETAAGLVLIDTGLGMTDIAYPQQRLSRQFRLLAQPRLDAAEVLSDQLSQNKFRRERNSTIALIHPSKLS